MPTPKTMRILVVEDDRTSRLLLRLMLEAIGGVEVIEAEDGQKAWEILERGLLPDLCFFDINMPRLTGLELLERVRKDKRTAFLKVCICSAVRERRIVLQAAAFQPDHYILKPYSKQLIQAQVERLRGGTAAEASLDPAEVVCGRLGIDKQTYLSMLSSLMGELSSLTTRIPTLLMQLDVKAALLALDVTRSAAQNLGAHRIVNLADSLTRCLKPPEGSVGEWNIPQDDVTAQTQKLVTQSMDHLLQVIRGLHVELETIRNLSAEIALAQPETDAAGQNEESRRAAEVERVTGFVTIVLRRGRVVASTRNTRSKSLSVPVRAALFGEDSPESMGVLTRRTSFTLSVLDPQTSEALEDCRRISDLVKLLSFRLDERTRWMPEAAILLLEREIALRNRQGTVLLRQAIGPDLDQFIEQQAPAIRDNVSRLCGDSPEAKLELDAEVQAILSTARERFQAVLEGQLAAAPAFTALAPLRLAEAADDATWAAPFGLLQSAALLFRKIATDPDFDRVFTFGTFDRQAFVQAMDVLDDPMASDPDPQRASAELARLEAIAAAPAVSRTNAVRSARCSKATRRPEGRRAGTASNPGQPGASICERRVMPEVEPPHPRPHHLEPMIRLALAVQDTIARLSGEPGGLQPRLGVHVGGAAAGESLAFPKPRRDGDDRAPTLAWWRRVREGREGHHRRTRSGGL
jgi:two-component system chemotaxis response regulator CheY